MSKAGTASVEGAVPLWSEVNYYAGNYVLNLLMDEASALERDQTKISDQRARATRAAIKHLMFTAPSR